MRMVSWISVCLLSFSIGFCEEEVPKTADPNASEMTRKIVSYFHELTQRSEKKLLSGQFLGWYPNVTMQPVEEIFQTSGKHVAIIGIDYYETILDAATLTEPVKEKPPRWRELNPLIKEYWKAGGLTTLSIHMTNPWTGGKAWDEPGRWEDLDDPQTPAGKAYRQQWKMIADGLEDLQKEGVVILFRPFHELDYAFWWRGLPPERIQKLWREMFHYLTQERQLHNLVWVYNGGRLRYPGNAYVDLNSSDYYAKTPTVAKAQYEALLSTGKPFAIGEFGPPGAWNDNTSPRNYDYSKFAEETLRAGSGIVYFLAWRDSWGMHRNPGVKELLNDPRVVNREDLQKELFSKEK
ncbi:MAG: glycosyl hydrolase [Planctomycetia bacterium]|nr:glycosyl hydrolase [Planctomycetia bacterium]